MFLPGHPFLFMNIVSELTKLHNNIGHISYAINNNTLH